MEVSEVLTCECNGKTYSNNRSLNEHKKRPVHINWERQKEVFDLKCRCKKLENELEAAKYDLSNYRYLLIQSQKREFSYLEQLDSLSQC
jgi:hypothetical protein